MIPRCRCGTLHRTWSTMAFCHWRRAVWVQGEGGMALVSRCNGSTTVSLHQTYAAAEQARRDLDRLGCGSNCTPDGHELVDLRA